MDGGGGGRLPEGYMNITSYKYIWVVHTIAHKKNIYIYI